MTDNGDGPLLHVAMVGGIEHQQAWPVATHRWNVAEDGSLVIFELNTKVAQYARGAWLAVVVGAE